MTPCHDALAPLGHARGTGPEPEAGVALSCGQETQDQRRPDTRHRRESQMPSLLWIIIIVLIVLFVAGYFGRGRFRS
jgi:cobalamin biosynthesis Mg chelatase CobN